VFYLLYRIIGSSCEIIDRKKIFDNGLLVSDLGIPGDSFLLLPQHGSAQHVETQLDQVEDDQSLARRFPELWQSKKWHGNRQQAQLQGRISSSMQQVNKLLSFILLVTTVNCLSNYV